MKFAYVKLIYLTFLLSVMSLSYAKEVIFAYEDKSNFPYYLGQGPVVPHQLPGSSVEIVKMAAEKQGIQVSFIRMPWKRCLSNLSSNLVDGTFNASFKPDRLKMGVYPFNQGRIDTSMRLLSLSYMFYVQKGSTISWDGQRFKNLTGNIGSVLGYSVSDILKKRGFPVDESPISVQQNLDMLLLGRVKVAAGSEHQVDYIISNNDKYK
ncbi:hypothetical protein BGC07_02985, partial [Piscirickettsia litoralis]